MVTFYLNAFFSFEFDYFHCVMPYLLGCKTTCFCSCLIWGESLQLRILRTGKFLCTFWELLSHSFRLILTDSREKKGYIIILWTRKCLVAARHFLFLCHPFWNIFIGWISVMLIVCIHFWSCLANFFSSSLVEY